MRVRRRLMVLIGLVPGRAERAARHRQARDARILARAGELRRLFDQAKAIELEARKRGVIPEVTTIHRLTDTDRDS